jgi:adenylosuccinate synthase
MKKAKKKKGAVDVVIGLQWGDEGKGKNIDALVASGIYAGVARFNGGANAGHTIKLGDKTFVGHIVPSGCFKKNIELYVGNGVIVDPVSLVQEIAELKSLGYDVTSRLFISNRAKLASYLHPVLDKAEEHYKGKGGKGVGTTMRGIGPAYADSRARRILQVGDISRPDFIKKEKDLSDFHRNLLAMYAKKYGFAMPLDLDERKIKWLEAVKILKKLKVVDVSALIQNRLMSKKCSGGSCSRSNARHRLRRLSECD